MTHAQIKRQLACAQAQMGNNRERIKAIEREQATLRRLCVELRTMLLDPTEQSNKAA
jgi:hypothetical protein